MDSTDVEWVDQDRDTIGVRRAKELLAKVPHPIRSVDVESIEPYTVKLNARKLARGHYRLDIPPILYYGGAGDRLVVLDGAHRIETAKHQGLPTIDVVVLTKADLDDIVPLD